MKKSAIALLFAAFLSVSAFAQSVQDGVSHMYAQRYESAKSAFEKLLASNPNNIEANYWLGQTLIAQKNVAGARSLYEKALAASNNAPLIQVGMGHVALLEGKAAEGRQQFEAAINASRGKKGNDANILNAIGRANVEAYTESTKAGDLDYAIAKLNEASQLAPANSDIFLNLGNAYRKKRDGASGGNAVVAFRKAAELNPKSGIAPYRTAMLYKTQVNYRQPDAWGVVLENLNAAVTADPKFAPAYEELYYYYLLAKKDFAAAETQANQYISSSDPSVENDYLKAQTQFVQNKFTEAVATAKNIVSQTNNNPKARVFRLLGYSYMGLKDTATACDFVNQFFTKATEEDIIGEDWILHAQSCGHNNPAIIRADLAKMLELDSVPARKVAKLREFAKEAKAGNQRVLEAELNWMSFNIEGPAANPVRLINDVTLPYYFGGEYLKADSAAKAYSALAPDSIWGYHWSGLALSAIDTSMEQGLAMPSFEKSLSVAEKDKVRFKSQGIRAAQMLAVYQYNVKSDKQAALAYATKGLEFDPANAGLLQIKDLSSRSAAPAKPAAGQRTNTSSGSGKTGTKASR